MGHREMQFPANISEGATGGPMYDTRIARLEAGQEYRTRRRNQPLHMWDVAHGIKSPADMDTLLHFFHIVGGMEDSFRYKDHLDYIATSAQGRLTRAYQPGQFVLTAVGSGEPDYWIGKRYTYNAFTFDRKILKLVSGSTTVYRNAGAVTVGVGAGNIGIDINEGLITFVADAVSSASSITPGTTTQVVLAANPGTLAIGEYLYLVGFSGANAASVNNLRHQITNITGSGPYTFTLATNTNGMTITLGSGEGRAYPQADDVLTAAFQFDIVARFNTDQMKVSLEHYNTYSWQQIPVVEVML